MVNRAGRTDSVAPCGPRDRAASVGDARTADTTSITIDSAYPHLGVKGLVETRSAKPSDAVTTVENPDPTPDERAVGVPDG